MTKSKLDIKKETSFLDTKDKSILDLSEEISSKLIPHETIIITYDRVTKMTDEWGLPLKVKD